MGSITIGELAELLLTELKERGEIMVETAKKDKAYEVLFRWKDKKKKASELVHVRVEAKTERQAIALAAMAKVAELAKADLLTLSVDVKVF